MLEDNEIKKILLEQQYVSAADMDAAEVATTGGEFSAVQHLIDRELISKDLIGQATAESLGVQYADLNSHVPTKDTTLRISKEIAEACRCVIFEEKEKEVVLATDDPKKAKSAVELKNLFTQKKLSFAYSLSEDIDSVFLHYREPLAVRFENILNTGERIAPAILEAILDDALIDNASDVHFEPEEESAMVRLRVDGILRKIGTIPKQYYESVLNRIKILAHLRTDKHHINQDGAIRYRHRELAVDIRVSIVPVMDGEKVVFRLLSEYARGFKLSALGLTAQGNEIVRTAIHKPFGMILNTGPTGSGKTTTMYSLLKILNTKEVNITTIEDPVEYKIQGVNHIQVDEQAGLTFKEGLRSIVRQDPNIVLVGEIRDRETAEIAINAALTGHLMFSTFHANDAATAIPRLLEMGIEPFLIASTLELVMAQRLVRTICEECKVSYNVTPKDIEKLIPSAKKYFSKKTTLYRGSGCGACSDTGFKGRSAIFEFIAMTDAMRKLVVSEPSTHEIRALAKKEGTQSLFDDGLYKVREGVTTLEELLRVANPPTL